MSAAKRRADDVKIRCTKCGYVALVPRLTHQEHITRHRTRFCPETRIRPLPTPAPVRNKPRSYEPPAAPKKAFCPECREQISGSVCFVCGYDMG
jgi:hypothetical protein